MEQKTVFISYRRAISKHLARSIYQDLKIHGWDVFLDVNTIDSGDFDRIILNQIGARAHFILLISPGSLERCANPGDWVLREIQEAVRLGRNIVPVIEETADFSREMAYLPDDLQAVISKKNALPLNHFYFDPGMDMLRTRFLKTPEYVRIQATPAADAPEVQRRIAQADVDPPGEMEVSALLPAPFEWIDIKDYSIAKYPVTNAQFEKFIEAGGYDERQWWTGAGWGQRQKDGWTQPRFWNDSHWNGAEHPVVGVSWYEAVAFCNWLNTVVGAQHAAPSTRITLPTEAQWQYAAQGDDGRRHPWGYEWDCHRCNNPLGECSSDGTTPVTQYEGKGDSPFGVVDMVGNVWEWCLTDYENRANHLEAVANSRALRGGAWLNDGGSGFFTCEFRIRGVPGGATNSHGFRILRQ